MAATADDWARAYARQADADYRALQLFAAYPDALAEECHYLLFLQMACEKACKAFLLLGGSNYEDISTSHAYVAETLPRLFREFLLDGGASKKAVAHHMRFYAAIAREIELLNPAVTRAGRRPDNCEYPWAAAGDVVSPLDQSFSASHLLESTAGRAFLKTLQSAIEFLVSE